MSDYPATLPAQVADLVISDALFDGCLRAFFKAPADKPSIELLLGMCDDPAAFRRALELAFDAGKREGMDEVTELSVMNVFDAEMDTMWERLAARDARHDIGEAIGDIGQLLLNNDPWVRGEAADRVVAVICKMFDRDLPQVVADV